MSFLQLLCVAALCTQAQQDPVVVTARLTDTRVEVGHATSLLITITTEGAAPDEIVMPSLPDELEIVGTNDYTHTQLQLGGARSRLTRRDVVIVPRAPGMYRIPPARITVRGTLYTSPPLELIVTGTAIVPGSEDRGSTLEVVLEPDTVYVGEQVVLHARATFAEASRLRQSRPPVFDPPAPSGFWIQDLPDPVTVSLRASEGRSVETQTYRRAYFPLRPGEYRLPPARLHYEVRRGFLYAPESRELVSDSARLVVLDAPLVGRPASWNGAVGRLEMRSAIEPRQVTAGEPAVITIELEGWGNVKSLPAPQLPELDGAEVFAPTQETVVTFDGDRVGGIKRFRWMIVPEEAGPLAIPPIEYAVFDPEFGTYVELSTEPLSVEARPAAAARPADTGIRALRRQPAGDGALSWVVSPAFAAAQAVPVLLLAGLVAVRRRRSRPLSVRQRARAARRDLAVLGFDADAAAIERALRSGILLILGTEAGDPVDLLADRGLIAEAERLRDLLGELRRARYEPGATFDPGDLIRQADALIADLARHGRPADSSGARNAMLLMPALLVPLLLSSPGPGDAQDASFAHALDLFERGDAVAAANAFRAYAQAQPRDVSGWYNEGVAAWHTDDPGRAVWAWLRALELAPRDADIRHNLRIAGAEGTMYRVLPVDRLTGAERALIAAVAWWLLFAAVAVMMMRGRSYPHWVALPAVVVLAAAMVVTATHAARPVIVVPMRDGATMYAAPTVREESLAVLRPGEHAVLVDRRDDWLLVRSPGGTDAWVERVAVAAP